MTSLNDTINICNGKCETEPSSVSGYIEEEHPDYGTLYYMKPPSYNNEVTVTTTIMTSTKSMTLHSLNELNSKLDNMVQKDALKPEQRELMFDIPISSSQESSFEGFGSSPFDKLQRLFYPNQQLQEKTSNENVQRQKCSPGKIVFSNFYDTIVEENSCNAVDMQMSKDIGQPQTRISSIGSHSNNSDMNPPSELSFNGKIRNLIKSYETTQTYNAEPMVTRCLSSLMESSFNTSQQFSESFILKKYSNEKSPDLFGDDDEEEEKGEEHDEKTQNYKNPPEHTIVLKELQPTLITCNLADNSFNCPTESSFANDDQTMDCSLTQGSGFGTSGNSSDSFTLFKANCRRECEMLRRIRKCLAGVLPPPSVTIPQVDMISAVLSKKDDILNFFSNIKDNSSTQSKNDVGAAAISRPTSLLRPTHTLEETKNMPWRDILSVRQHGLCYNLNKASENNEYLSLSVMDRFIGAETTSSYRNSPSSAKKRNTRLKLLCQSPGNRLSHLAKRRAIFSSANLATQKTSTLVGPQILVEKKKVKNRRKSTPKHITAGSRKKNRKTPSSSARKRLFRNDIVKPGPSRETSKRALFQSPAKGEKQGALLPKPPAMKPELANRVEKSKRALLFTPEKQQQQQQNEQKSISNTYFAPSTTAQLDKLLKRKRDRCDDTDDVDTADLTSQSSKLFKTSSSTSITPRTLKIKSQSFCIGAGSPTKYKQLPCAFSTSTTSSNISLYFTGSNSNGQQLQHNNSLSSILGCKLQKSYSDNATPSNSLTENQKKKLLWAVSQALQEKKITVKHESFKEYATILARVVRRIFQEYYQKNSTSNSETMLRLAKKYVYLVTSGSSVDDIYLQAKTQIEETKRQSTTRLSGYIGPEEYQQLKQQSLSQSASHKGSFHNVFTADNSFDSFGLISQSSSGFCGSTNGISEASFLGQISQDILISESSQSSNSRSETKSIQINTSLQNSSSKSNLCGVVLRENVDCELRRSAQKNFTGKDQRNVSPYAGGNNNGGSAIKTHIQLITDIATNTTKAKRQISFDS